MIGRTRVPVTVALACAALASAVLVFPLAGTAVAARPSSANLVVNGAAEVGQAAADDTQIAAPQGWKTTGEFTQVQYGADGGFPVAAFAATISGGNAFFAGGNTGVSTATQTLRIPSSWMLWVKRGHAGAVLSADLGGYGDQSDWATVTVSFLGKSGSTLRSLVIGPVTYLDRAEATVLYPRSVSRRVPFKARQIRIVLKSHRVDGEYNDGYIDNVSLVLQR